MDAHVRLLGNWKFSFFQQICIQLYQTKTNDEIIIRSPNAYE